MITVIKKLSLKRPHRIFNGIISFILFVWILTIRERVYYASGIREHYKFDLLLLVFSLYFMQTFLNKKWLNTALITVYSILIGYVFYSYVFALFDDNDNVMDKQNGVLIKTWGTLLKVSILSFAIWFTRSIRPNK